MQDLVLPTQSSLCAKLICSQYSLLYLPLSVSVWVSALGPMLIGFAVVAESWP